jgi:hypothetical protein
MLNRDIVNNEVDIYDIESHKGLKAEIDTRVFTEDGQNQIKKEARDAYEHGEDIGKTVHTVATDEKIGIENILDNAQDNFASTKTKNFLTDTAEGQKIAEGLKADPNSQEYQEAKVAAIKVYQDIRGIEESEVVHYDAKATQQDALKNVAGVDVQGATLTKGDNAGTILLDASGDENGNSNKQQDMFVAGHEIGETKYLQNGNGVIFEDSYDTKEAMNDALGSSLTNRLNQATDGSITSTTYATSSNDYVKSGTTTSNQLDVVDGGVEYKQLAKDEKTHIANVSKDYAKEKGISEDEAYNKLYDRAMYAIDNDSRKDHAPISKKQQEQGFISATNETLQGINEDIAYLKDTSKGKTIIDVYKEDMTSQAMFTATPEQANNPDYDPDNSKGLEDQSLGLAPVTKVGTTTAKGIITIANQGAKKADDVILNTGIKVDNYLKNNVHENASQNTVDFLNGFGAQYPKPDIKYPYINSHTAGYITKKIVTKIAE